MIAITNVNPIEEIGKIRRSFDVFCEMVQDTEFNTTSMAICFKETNRQFDLIEQILEDNVKRKKVKLTHYTL